MVKVIKIGGNVVDDSAALEAFCRDFAALEGPKVLVHGGGALASQIQKALGQEPIKIAGRRVTDSETLKVVTMVYSGLCNKTITALLQKEGCNAIGLSGCDGNVICARKRDPLKIDGREVDFGFVGDVTPECINKEFIQRMIAGEITPVLCAINHDGRGNLLNTNADTIASSVAIALRAELVYCFEKDGVLMDKDDNSSVIPVINHKTYLNLKAEGIIADGMIPKLENAFKAMYMGAGDVTIKNASNLLNDKGTVLCK